MAKEQIAVAELITNIILGKTDGASRVDFFPQKPKFPFDKPYEQPFPRATPNIINLRLDITHLYYPAKNSFQKGRLKRREIFTELLLYTLTT